jgi:hypothetical protein
MPLRTQNDSTLSKRARERWRISHQDRPGGRYAKWESGSLPLLTYSPHTTHHCRPRSNWLATVGRATSYITPTMNLKHCPLPANAKNTNQPNPPNVVGRMLSVTLVLVGGVPGQLGALNVPQPSHFCNPTYAHGRQRSPCPLELCQRMVLLPVCPSAAQHS